MGGGGGGQGLSAILRPQGAKRGDKVVDAPGLLAEVLCRKYAHRNGLGVNIIAASRSANRTEAKNAALLASLNCAVTTTA